MAELKHPRSPADPAPKTAPGAKATPGHKSSHGQNSAPGQKPSALHHEIAETLIQEILTGRYQPGDRLPSERDLASRFQANRGSVREAVKKLEQIGLVDVQPGGARILPVEESSLDVIGHLFTLQEVPDPALVDQVLTVVASLMRLAVESAVNQASDTDIRELRDIVAELLQPGIDQEMRLAARMALGHKFLRSSNNLPLMLIARSLRMQFVEHLVGFNRHFNVKKAAHRARLAQLDQALHQRDAETASHCMGEIFETDKATLLKLLAAANSTPQGARVDPDSDIETPSVETTNSKTTSATDAERTTRS